MYAFPGNGLRPAVRNQPERLPRYSPARLAAGLDPRFQFIHVPAAQGTELEAPRHQAAVGHSQDVPPGTVETGTDLLGIAKPARLGRGRCGQLRHRSGVRHGIALRMSVARKPHACEEHGQTTRQNQTNVGATKTALSSRWTGPEKNPAQLQRNYAVVVALPALGASHLPLDGLITLRRLSSLRPFQLPKRQVGGIDPAFFALLAVALQKIAVVYGSADVRWVATRRYRCLCYGEPLRRLFGGALPCPAPARSWSVAPSGRPALVWSRRESA
jgi:hypothetical protein